MPPPSTSTGDDSTSTSTYIIVVLVVALVGSIAFHVYDTNNGGKGMGPTITKLKGLTSGGGDGLADPNRVMKQTAIPHRMSFARWSAADASEARQDRDLSPDIGPPRLDADLASATYELFAIVAHAGRSGCGHYTSYVKAPDDAGMPPRCAHVHVRTYAGVQAVLYYTALYCSIYI